MRGYQTTGTQYEIWKVIFFSIVHTSIPSITIALIVKLPPFHNSYVSYGVTWSHAPGALPPATARAFIFAAKRLEHALPSSIRVEICVHTVPASKLFAQENKPY